ncbi:DUF4918 family protein [Lactobacillus helsingborgensis]|uniref:uracil-DNA glycosylase family protein n=1 Tax=Lactobacillus helsingborgensis TaxID=1218494 RepID=UPI00164FF60D|nr:uracil-DNA glycosylase family protein [Lactobacillus helsingborgensis]MBC6356725.1 DUF4918 family protein [Lactobacillus helsingborgensis]
MSLTTYEKILTFYEGLENVSINLPTPFKLLNPYKGSNIEKVRTTINLFYKKYYNDSRQRKLIVGSSPARQGTAITGIPFEDPMHIGYSPLENYYTCKASSKFLYDVFDQYGGRQKFYDDFYLGFVCPLGISKLNSKGNEVNCNYYDNKTVLDLLMPLIIESLKKVINFGIDTTTCICIGSGKNYKELKKINNKEHFFKQILPLEHPRFITQYNLKEKEKYLNKYLAVLKKV